MARSIYDFECKDIQGTLKPLSDYKGQVLLIVNTASNCGYTPQYEGLEALYREFSEQGFSVLGFPCNQFLKQEPADEAEIQTFCSTRYDVTFPMFSKIKVNGPEADPLYQFLTTEAKGVLGSKPVKWNFTKFLINQEGEVVERFATATKPEALSSEIKKLLSKTE